MKNNHDAPTVNLSDDPALHHAAFVAAFNTGDVRAVDQVYADDAVLVPSPGLPMTGTQRSAAVQHLLSMGLPIEAEPRHVYVSGDIALLIVDWSMSDETGIRLQGTATDVARRGADGLWRYVIDNPFGTA
ncbi:nuclear transport factor 2 family protein [Streptosporangium soli]|nr:nuclear transport factor 2 family protein [Streptosporangium sp. KLBMP 9127]MCG5220774.1 nuclear transport factor 2 family protein [Streptosporangium sp. KLBMP 9127]